MTPLKHFFSNWHLLSSWRHNSIKICKFEFFFTFVKSNMGDELSVKVWSKLDFLFGKYEVERLVVIKLILWDLPSEPSDVTIENKESSISRERKELLTCGFFCSSSFLKLFRKSTSLEKLFLVWTSPLKFHRLHHLNMVYTDKQQQY